MSLGYDTSNGVPLGLPSIVSLGLTPGINPYPALDLDFIQNGLDSRITFSRGSQATLFDSTGTLVYAKHNLLLQSEAFNTTWTTSDASITANSTTAPNATTTADTLVEAATANFHFVSQTVSGTTNTNNYTMSCFIKASTRTAARISIIEGTTLSRQVRATADLSAGTVVGAGLNGATLTAATITPVGNDWYRVTVAGVLGGTDTNIFCAVYVGQNPSTFNYTGDGTSGIFIWGAQLNITAMEGGVTSSLSTYYPTVASAYYGPRFDYDPSTLQPLGLLIEEQRTNSIRNNTMQGAVAGSPGTEPTNWAAASVGGSITTKTIAAVTSENGVSCIDYRYVFSTSGTANVRTEATTQIAAVVGQTWTASAYLKLQAGSLSNLTINVVIRECDAGGATLVETAQAFTPTTANLATQRATLTRTLAAVGTAFVVAIVQFSASGAADATLRIGLPQLEQGAFATSVVATTTTALTRNADVASMTGTNFSSWFNSAQGTMIAEFSRNTTPAASTFPQFFNIDDGSVNNRLALFTNSSLAMTGQVAIGGVFTSLLTGQSWSLGVPSKLGLAYQALNYAASANGSTVVTNTAVNVPSGLTAARIGDQAGGGGNANAWIRRIAYYSVRLPNTTLQALSA